MRPETRYKGAIKLSAIGDALGWITEFEKSSISINQKYGTDYISSFFEWKKNVGGRFNGYTDYLTKGSYSDDTQLMLSVARSIKIDGKVDENYFSKIELPSWLKYSRGAGRTIKNAAHKIERKSAQWNNNFFTYKVGNTTVDYRESGANGAAMRILPIALANFGDIETIKEEIFANSIVTHGHPRAIVGALLYGYSIDTILRYRPDNFTYESFLTELGKDIHQKLDIPFINKNIYKSWEKEWNKKANAPFRKLYESTLSETQKYLREVYKCLIENTENSTVLKALGCYDPETKGSGISTVLAGIYLCCKYIDKPLKGMEDAVNLIGTDTDSIASFTGGLSGALHGTSIIPERFKDVQDSNYLDTIAIRLLEISEDSASNIEKTDKSNLKSINSIDNDNFNIGESVFFNPLGKGIIINIDRQDTFTKGKYNLIIDVDFEIGQSCRFAQILSKSESANSTNVPFVKFPDKIILDHKIKDQINKFAKELKPKQKEEFQKIINQILLSKDC